MYDFLYYMWILGKADESKIQYAVTKGYITQEQANTILSTPVLKRSGLLCQFQK